MASTRQRNISKARVRQPRLRGNDLEMRATKALLAVKTHPLVAKRLPEGFLEALKADVDFLTRNEIAVRLSRTQSLAATMHQDARVAELALFVTAVRTAVRKATTERSVRTAYGVGLKMHSRLVYSVTAAALKIVRRAGDHPEEARGFGILESDIPVIAALIKQAEKADADQKDVRAKSPRATRERNETERRVWAGICIISSRGMMAYALDPQGRAIFDVLDDLPKRRKKKTPEPAEEPPPPAD